MSTTAEPLADIATTSTPEAKAGHPRALYLLFATEMWERFCFYGMRALLVPYLRYELHWQPSDSSSAYKWYTSLVYLTPMLGGMLADRYLGLRVAIITGAILLSVGEFMLTSNSSFLFYAALAVLIFGNGFFKPNISTIVGKLYRTGDPRRDSAFTIFYMGINVGAGLAPFVCSTLGEKIGYRYGFAAAGVGMIIGTVTFVLGQKRIRADVEAAGNSMNVQKKEPGASKEVVREASEALPGATGIAGLLSKVFPLLMIGVAVIVPVWSIVQVLQHKASFTEVVMPAAFALISGWMGATLLSIKGAARDKASVIFILFLFVVLFWMAFEQAGNAMNIWAFEHTDRKAGSFEYPAGWFQSVNSIFIVLLAPAFAWLWTKLEQGGKGVSTPAKMFVAMVLVAASFGAMVFAALSENGKESRVPIAALPAKVDLSKIDAGRLTYDTSKKELVSRGVLPAFVVGEALAPTVDESFRAAVKKLEGESKPASDKAPVTTKLEATPPGFTFPMDAAAAKKHDMTWDAATKTIVFTGPLDASAKVALLGAGAPEEWRTGLDKLAEESNKARVSGIWLVLFYFFSTLGELCLSPVGLSMVTKLAPMRFASLFMGVWFLAPSVALYAGGAIGEMWGEITPTNYFWIFVWSSVAGAVLLLMLVPPLKRLMHDVT